ncbi:MAG TPA: YfhO family protein [Kofleriaceae bacterium]|nr:YfhO family protein [Kofleriaceae bacterium]
MTAPRAAPLGVMVALLWLVGVAPVLLGGRTFAAPAHAAETLVWHQAVADAIAGGHLAEWDETAGLGQPLAGAPGRAAVYPPVWLEALAPMPWAADAVLLLHLLLLALGVALWSRRLGADPAAAAAAGGAAACSGFAWSLAGGGGPLLAAAWLPFCGWAASRLGERWIAPAALVAASAGAVLLAGPSGPLLAVPVVALAGAIASGGETRRVLAALAAALAAAALLGAAALVPAAALGSLVDCARGGAGSLAPVDVPLLLFALAAAPRLPRVAVPAAALLAAGMVAAPVRDAALSGGLAIAWPLAGVGLSRAFGWLLASSERWRAAVAALVAAVLLGVPAVRCWRQLTARAELEGPPALVASLAGERELPDRIAWPDRRERPDRDAPPRTAARFGFAYLPAAGDAELARVWRASSGAAERLMDLLAVEYVLVPASVVVPAALEVVAPTARGDQVLAVNAQRRPRAFVAPRWSWHRDPAALAADLFPAAPDQRSHAALAEVRLLGAGPASQAAAGEPAPACSIRSPRPEEVELGCHAPAGGRAVLLDRFAPGWRAWVDGRPVAIERADLLVRSVPLPAGRHAVRFRYRTPGLRLGLAVSALAWLALGALVVIRRRYRPGPE